MQALSEETRRLAINERSIYNQNICIYTRVSWLHLTPTKLGLALHCHGEIKLTDGRNGRERDTKRKMELFPHALALLQALQNVFFVPPHNQRSIPLKQTKRNRLKLPHQHRCRSLSSPHRSVSKKCKPINVQC